MIIDKITIFSFFYTQLKKNQLTQLGILICFGQIGVSINTLVVLFCPVLPVSQYKLPALSLIFFFKKCKMN